LFMGLGHHVLKLGADAEVSIVNVTQAYTGGRLLGEYAPEDFPPDGAIESLQYGYGTGPDQARPLQFIQSRAKSVLIGAFVQDSWSVLDRVTLNVGVRFDTQTLYGTGDQVGLTFPHEWSPRVGVIWDPTQQGRSKFYASYARYYESIPLDIALNAFGPLARIDSFHLPPSGACNPRSPSTASCATPDTLIPEATW